MPYSLPKIPILMYHSVPNLKEGDKKARNTNPAYSLSVNQFREQMEYIHKNGYKTLHLDQLLDENTQVPEKSLVITFDDGWADNYTNVFPILKEYGLTATIFIVTGFIGQPNYMSWDQLGEMSKAGISIQSHTVNHKPLAQLSKTEIEYELETSKKTIGDALGTPVKFLSLPHGLFNNKVMEMAQEAAYQAVCSSEPGFAHIWKGLPFFRRINISDRYRIDFFEKIVQGDSKIVIKAFLTKKIKNIARSFLGYKIYRRIYLLKYDIKD